MPGSGGLALLMPLVDAVITRGSMTELLVTAVPAVGLLLSATVLMVARSEDDLGWRGLLCLATRTALPALSELLRPALSDRQLAVLDGPL